MKKFIAYVKWIAVEILASLTLGFAVGAIRKKSKILIMCWINWLKNSMENLKIEKVRCAINDFKCCGPLDWDHVTSRGAGGPDTESNLVVLCRLHHTERHTIGICSFIDKYTQYRRELEEMGRFDVIEKCQQKGFL